MKETGNAWEDVRPEELPAFLREHAGELIGPEHPFADYMRAKIRQKGLLQQEVFLAADVSENYGYKLISGEKHTVRRDVIVRLCLAARFCAEETDEALMLYGMAPLHPRFARDVVLRTAVRARMYDVQRVNELLAECGQAPLTDP